MIYLTDEWDRVMSGTETTDVQNITQDNKGEGMGEGSKMLEFCFKQ